MTKLLFFLAPLPALGKRTRLSKMTSVLRELGFEIRFFGWERLPGELSRFSSDDIGVHEESLMRGGGYTSLKVRFLYPLWMWCVFWKTLRLGKRHLIFCLGWETAFPALLAAQLTGARIVFDDADRFSLFVALPPPLAGLLIKLERWTSRNSHLHLVPGFARYDWHHSGMTLLRNSPTLKDFRSATSRPPRRPDGRVVLYANGWIGETRGAPVFLELLNLADEHGIDLKLVIAGRLDGPSAKKLTTHKSSLFLGEIAQHEALAWYAVVDAVLTYYDPSVPINTMAESNKWGDAVFFGCPVIVNSEVETAKTLVDSGAAFSAPYKDARSLLEVVKALAGDQDLRNKASQAAASCRTEYPTFDEQLTEILSRI